jgi:hypothetical protein
MTQDYTQENFLPTETAIYQTANYAGIGLDIAGTFTSGSLKLQGTVDGATWTDLFTVKNGEQVANNLMIATGHYSANCLGFGQVRVLPASLVGSLKLTAHINARVPQITATVIGE